MIVAVCLLCPAFNRVVAQTDMDTAALMRQIRAGQQAGRQITANGQRLKQKVEEAARSTMLANSYTDRTRPADSTRSRLVVSLLTCGPGTEIYEYYGHSAIRIRRQMPQNNAADASSEKTGNSSENQGDLNPYRSAAPDSALDLVFNYGVFDFHSGNFVLRFALGHTDYICAVQQTRDFLDNYRREGRFVEEQILNLTQEESAYLLNSLLTNSLPQNRVYRYNFFYDNCATRVRDKIEEAVDGVLKYPDRPVSRSWRDAVHFYSHYYRWSTFAQDLVLGSQADQKATGRELEFVPMILEQDYRTTLIQAANGIIYPLVRSHHRLLDLPPLRPREAFPLSPLAVSVIVLVGGMACAVIEWRRRKIFWGIDTAAIALQGLAGCVVAFLFFFSTHPAVGSNWLIWVLNPLPLFGLYFQIRGALHRRYYAYHIVAAPVLAAFLIALIWIPQQISLPAVLLVVFLLGRSALNIAVGYSLKHAAARPAPAKTNP